MSLYRSSVRTSICPLAIVVVLLGGGAWAAEGEGPATDAAEASAPEAAKADAAEASAPKALKKDAAEASVKKEEPKTGKKKESKTGGPQDMKVQVPVPEEPAVRKAPGVKLPKEAELRKRAQARWDAMIAGDMKQAYGFEAPAYRKAHTLLEYQHQFGHRVRWHVAKVKDLSYTAADLVDVIIELDYSFALSGGDQLARTRGDIKDRWVFVDGQWWRQHRERSLRGKKQSQPSLER